MNHFYVIANSTREGALETAFLIREYLESLGKTCLVDEGTKRRIGMVIHTGSRSAPRWTVSWCWEGTGPFCRLR